MARRTPDSASTTCDICGDWSEDIMLQWPAESPTGQSRLICRDRVACAARKDAQEQQREAFRQLYRSEGVAACCDGTCRVEAHGHHEPACYQECPGWLTCLCPCHNREDELTDEDGVWWLDAALEPVSRNSLSDDAFLAVIMAEDAEREAEQREREAAGRPPFE